MDRCSETQLQVGEKQKPESSYPFEVMTFWVQNGLYSAEINERTTMISDDVIFALYPWIYAHSPMAMFVFTGQCNTKGREAILRSCPAVTYNDLPLTLSSCVVINDKDIYSYFEFHHSPTHTFFHLM